MVFRMTHKQYIFVKINIVAIKLLYEDDYKSSLLFDIETNPETS